MTRERQDEGMNAKGVKGMFPMGQGPEAYKGKNLGPLKGKGWPGPKGSLPMGPKGMGKGPMQGHMPCKGYGPAHPQGLMAPVPLAPMMPHSAPERPQATQQAPQATEAPQAQAQAAPIPDAAKASPAARRKTLGPLMPPLPPSALRPDAPVPAPEEVGGWPAEEVSTSSQPATQAVPMDSVGSVAQEMPEMPVTNPRPAPSMSAAPVASQAPAAAMPSMPSMPSSTACRSQASRKTATQLRSELNRLREEMERRQNEQGLAVPASDDGLKEELRKLQKQLEESERENQELRAKQTAPSDSAPAPRRRGRKSLRNRTMDLTAHRNADWEEVEGASSAEDWQGFFLGYNLHFPKASAKT